MDQGNGSWFLSKVRKERGAGSCEIITANFTGNVCSRCIHPWEISPWPSLCFIFLNSCRSFFPVDLSSCLSALVLLSLHDKQDKHRDRESSQMIKKWSSISPHSTPQLQLWWPLGCLTSSLASNIAHQSVVIRGRKLEPDFKVWILAWLGWTVFKLKQAT